MDQMHAGKRDLETRLAVQRQARLNLSEKLDAAQASLNTAESDSASHESRLSELESRLSKDQRLHTTSESQYREQLTERSTLLLTICKYVGQVLGVDKKRSGDEKPFTNFSVFHDRILERLRSLTMLNTEFVKRTKELEARLMGKIQEMDKALDNRMKGLDKFELSLKTVAEARMANVVSKTRRTSLPRLKSGSLSSLSVTRARRSSGRLESGSTRLVSRRLRKRSSGRGRVPRSARLSLRMRFDHSSGVRSLTKSTI